MSAARTGPESRINVVKEYAVGPGQARQAGTTTTFGEATLRAIKSGARLHGSTVPSPRGEEIGEGNTVRAENKDNRRK